VLGSATNSGRSPRKVGGSWGRAVLGGTKDHRGGWFFWGVQVRYGRHDVFKGQKPSDKNPRMGEAKMAQVLSIWEEGGMRQVGGLHACV